jgi:hypothetical protein
MLALVQRSSLRAGRRRNPFSTRVAGTRVAIDGGMTFGCASLCHRWLSLCIVIGVGMAALASGCTNRDGSPEAGEDAVEPIDEAALDVACAGFAEALCERRIECNPCGAERRYGRSDACEEIEQQRCMGELALTYVDRVVEGVHAAVAALDETDCELIEGEVRPTARPGKRRKEEACFADAQCGSGLFCSRHATAACGTCAEGIASGPDQAAQPSDCAQSREPAAGYVPTGGQCGRAYMGEDKGPCGPDDVCALPPGAQPGFYDGYNVCTKRPGLGDPCPTYSRICPSELNCDKGTCQVGPESPDALYLTVIESMTGRGELGGVGWCSGHRIRTGPRVRVLERMKQSSIVFTRQSKPLNVDRRATRLDAKVASFAELKARPDLIEQLAEAAVRHRDSASEVFDW